jgi:glucokinase
VTSTQQLTASTQGEPPLYLGISIGGATIAAAVVDSAGRVHSAARIVTAGKDDEEALWRAVESVGDDALAGAGIVRVDGIGCGCAGPMLWPEGAVSPLNLPQWREFPLAARISQKWPFGPVRVHNDAVCVAVAEHWVGSLRGSSNALGMIVSTGVGGGLISADRVINGGLGNAGHIGHVVVDPEGPPCYCGGVGCLEAIARGPAIVEWAVGQGWTPGDGQPPNGVNLMMSAAEGDHIARAAFRRSGEAVGQALASVAAMLDLDAVAIGGGLMHAGELLLGPISEAFERHAGFGFVRRMSIRPATTGKDAGLIGAAALVAQGGRYWTVLS